MKMQKTLKEVYRPKYILLNAAFAIAYYFIIQYLLSIQQNGIPITSVPLYLIYLLSIVSSVTLTIAVYSISNTRKNHAKLSATGVSAATTLFGGVVSGCGCQAAILFNLIAISAGTGEATLINTSIANNAPLIFVAMIILNLFVVTYYLEKLSKPACRIKR